VNLRKIAGLLAVFGLALGLIGGNVEAIFTDQVTAQQNINAGALGCIISASDLGTIAGDTKSVVYNAPAITSPAPGSAPFTFTVMNTGSIPLYLQVTGVVTGTNNAPFSSILVVPATAGPIASSATQLFNAGLQWTALGSGQLGQSYSASYTVACSDSAFVS
jgi:hypothetical protein